MKGQGGGDQAATHKHLKSSYTDSAAKLSSFMTNDITWVHSNNLQLGRLRADISSSSSLLRSSAASSEGTQDSWVWEQSSKKP